MSLSDKRHPARMARPTSYTPELGARICDTIAAATAGLRVLCKAHDFFPNSPDTILRWCHQFPEFSEHYARALALRAEHLVEEGLEIADDGSADYEVVSKDGKVSLRVDTEVVARSRLRADYRMRMAQSMDAKKWGLKQQVEHSGSIDLNINTMAVEDILAELEDLVRLGFVPKPEDERIDAEEDFSDLG